MTIIQSAGIQGGAGIEHGAGDLSGGTAHSATARQTMIESQLRPSGVNAPWVLTAMATTPRENFVPADARDFAYIDRAVPLGGGRFLAPPLFHGRMLEEAAPTATDRVLVVTAGSDYLGALVRPVAASLTGIDAKDATGAIAGGDYTLILVDGAAGTIPSALTAALVENGRIVTGIVVNGLTRLAAGRKVRGEVSLMPLAEMAIPVLPELAAPRHWRF